MSSLTEVFLHDHAARMRGLYPDRIATAIAPLAEEDLWWRPHGGTTSIGQLLRHLRGNVRQWVCSGLGGQPDRRDRAGEFAGEDRPAKADLLARLRETAEDAARVIEGLDEAALARRLEVQAFQTTGYEIVAHVLEHFAWHAGQVVWIAKARLGAAHGIAFYDDAALNAARNP